MKEPQSNPTNIAAINAVIYGARYTSVETSPPARIKHATAPASAHTAPTEISVPPDEATTRVMPTASITSSLARFITSIMYP